MLNFDNVRVQQIDWMNEHGTYRVNGVERLLPIASPSGEVIERWRRVGSVLQAVVGHAFQHAEPLRVDGSRWSLSNIAQPARLALSLAAHDVAEEVPQRWRSPAYQTSLAAADLTPMLVSGSMKIHRLNRVLALHDLALQTSGASDGQTVAGASAAGTHGAALHLGAFHDTFRAVHLMVAPNEAVLVQPSNGPFLPTAAADLSHWLGFPTHLITEDRLFRAAVTHLGSLGILLNAVIEVRPLYVLSQVTTPHTDPAWRQVLDTHSTAGIAGHSTHPCYLQVVVNPYPSAPSTRPRAWVTSMTDARYTQQAGVRVNPGAPEAPNPDLLALISSLSELDDVRLGDLALRKYMTQELVSRYGTALSRGQALPGVTFGPSGLPRGRGESVEFVVDAGQALMATDAIVHALDSERKAGRQFLGAIGIRFVAGSDAWLAPNARPLSCFIELPTIRSNEMRTVYAACGAALTARGIAYGCHWGQRLVDIQRGLTSYWGAPRVQGWLGARHEILTTDTARRVFASPLLKDAGLE